MYHYTQCVTLYVVVHLRCRDDVAFELEIGITSGLRLHRRRAWTQMKSQLPETGRSCSAASPGSWYEWCGLPAAPTLESPHSISDPRPTRPVHATPSARSRPAESKQQVPARANRDFSCISAGQEVDPDSGSCF